MQEFQDALGHLDMEHTAEFNLSVKGRTVVLDLLDTGIGEFLLTRALDKNRIMANIALSRVQRVVRVLKDPEKDPVEEAAPSGA
jgi:hypothetical protein